jgi:adenine-specific DNA-methyltransferase
MNILDLKKVLGKPYYEAPNCLIYCDDCLAGMKQLPNNLIHLTVTSPPYNIGKTYEDLLPLDAYLDWCEQWIAEIHRTSCATSSFWLNLGYLSIPERAKAIPIPYLLWDRIPFFLIQEVVWHYGAGVAGKKFFSPRNEKFLWYVKDVDNYTFNLDEVRDPNVKYPRQKKHGKIKVNPLGKNPGDVWLFPKVTSGKNRASAERTAHPAQFPEEVITRIVKASSDEGDLVFDPFMGSGTTAKVALELGRNVIGFEKLPEYCDIIASRIDDFLRSQQQPKQQALPLFDEWQA